MSLMNYEILGNKDGFPIVFGHGWARDHRDFIPVAELLGDRAKLILLDLPGFGASPRPETAWDTQDYAKATRDMLEKELGLTRYIWVGHSFGGRVGLRLAQMSDSPVAHLFVVAGAGVPREVPQTKKWRGKLRSWQFKRKKAAASSEEEIIALEKQFGSADYVASRESGLRDIFIKAVQENQTDQLASITCPTTFLYGANDTETPPEIGKKMHALVPNSTYLECPEYDHLTILSRGRHQMTLMLKEALQELGE